MSKLINNNTDLVIVLLTLASIGLTFLNIMDVKDFGAIVLAVFSFKFGKANPTIVSQPTPNQI